KDVPEKHEVFWKDLMTIPLKKRPAPKWSADAKVAGGSIVITAQRGELPSDAKIEYRIDTAKAKPIEGSRDLRVSVPTSSIVPGVHIVTLQATLPDERAYQLPVIVTVPG